MSDGFGTEIGRETVRRPGPSDDYRPLKEETTWPVVDPDVTSIGLGSDAVFSADGGLDYETLLTPPKATGAAMKAGRVIVVSAQDPATS